MSGTATTRCLAPRPCALPACSRSTSRTARVSLDSPRTRPQTRPPSRLPRRPHPLGLVPLGSAPAVHGGRGPRASLATARPLSVPREVLLPYAAMGRCSEPGCPELALPKNHGKCGEHTRAAWGGTSRPSSTERYGMSGSAQQSLHRDVLREQGYICYVCGLPGADEVDHIIPIHLKGARKDKANLGAIHGDPCHANKTKRENAERRAARAALKAARAGLTLAQRDDGTWAAPDRS